MSFEHCLTNTIAELEIKYKLKDEQKKALQFVCARKHTFAVLPTGYGKSDIYGLAPDVLSKLETKEARCLVISPLRVLMSDQESRWRMKGVKCHVLRKQEEMSSHTINEIENGNWKLLFAPPESLKLKKWRDLLRNYRTSIRIICLDEVHCMIDWGQSFRPEYANVGQIRGILTDSTLLLTTATMTEDMQKEIVGQLGMHVDDFETVATVPDRPNIFIEVITTKRAAYEEKLAWYAEKLKDEGVNCGKCIIFVRSQKDMVDIFGYLTDVLGDSYWVGDYGAPGDCLAEMFYAQTDPISEVQIPLKFKDPQSVCRCLVSTVAFGLGMEIPDIELIIHWGPPNKLWQYWQESGRAGRDGRQSRAIMYLPPQCTRKGKTEKCLYDFIKGRNCLRRVVLQTLKIGTVTEDDIDACCGGESCCSVCASGASVPMDTDDADDTDHTEEEGEDAGDYLADCF